MKKILDEPGEEWFEKYSLGLSLRLLSFLRGQAGKRAQSRKLAKLGTDGMQMVYWPNSSVDFWSEAPPQSKSMQLGNKSYRLDEHTSANGTTKVLRTLLTDQS